MSISTPKSSFACTVLTAILALCLTNLCADASQDGFWDIKELEAIFYRAAVKLHTEYAPVTM